MTRPTHRLYVFTSMPPKSADAAESVPVFFRHYLELKGNWNKNETVYQFGEKTLFEDKTKESTELYRLDNFISTSWRNRMLLSLQAAKNWDLDDQALKQQWGNLVHLVLSQIRTAEDAEPILEKFESDGIINSDDKESIQAVLKPFLSHPDVSKYFLPGLKVKTEPEILLPNGKTFRPDRIVFNEDQTTIIDFKTGKPEELHKEQVRFYMKLIKDMGYAELNGVLLYVNEPDPLVAVG